MVETNISSQNINIDSPLAKKSLWKTALEWLPYPIATAVGYYAFDIEVRKGIYRNIAKHGYFNDLQAERNTPYKAVLNRGAIDGKSVAPELHELQETYRNAVGERFRTKLGMKGMRDYWQGLERNQKITSLVMGATVTSIILGAAFLIKENDKIQEAFDNMTRRRKEKEQNEI